MYVYDSVVAGGDGDYLGASHVIWASPLSRYGGMFASLPLASRYWHFVRN